LPVTQGWTVTGEYVDRVTGKHSDRERFQKLFQDSSETRLFAVVALVTFRDVFETG